MSKWWKEKYLGKYVFYAGLLSKKEVRLGFSIGNENTSFDLLWFTCGFMKA
ncbi:hypothetical protein JK635_02410 [Neobacillus sp. YIM B02564]|uniref:Uncharacterized protein n=1 Tax=Neobacillus paridis TaxID=2803862 RepID=A0ABS1TIT8_9BACI|nr:hypothetical protein [Neobacillus paridis]MBL4951093.1 hypothetical protein [Neobacillus paridis]